MQEPPSDTSPSPIAAESQLVKSIGLSQAVALYVGAILGAGVLVLPGVTATTAGPAALVSWAFVGGLGIPLGLTFAALARRSPGAGGVSGFAAEAFGTVAGDVAGWWFFVAGSVGQAIVPLTGATYLAAAVGWGRLGTFVSALAILALAVLANLRGLRVGARIQLILALSVGVVLLVAIAVALPDADADRLTPFAPKGISAIGIAAVPLFFAFAGWEVIAHLSAEFADPERDIVRATVITAGVVIALYLGICFAVVATGAYGEPQLDRTAVATILGRGIGVGAATTAAVTAVVIALGTTNAFVAGCSRLAYAMGRSGAMPSPLGVLSPQGVPVRGIGAVSVVAGLGLVVTAVAGGNAEDLLFVPASLVIATYVMAMAAGIRLLEGRARILAVIGLVPTLAVVPFLGWSLALPIGLAGLVVASLRNRERPQVAAL